MKDVANKVAVITGAASGIGRGIAECFGAAGMKLVLADVEEEALRKSNEALRGAGFDTHPVVTDVSRAEQVRKLADEALKRFGAVHVLCNNAGIVVGNGAVWQTSLDDWKWILDVNLMGVVHGVRTFVPIMLEQDVESHIVNTASVTGFIAGYGAYGVTKSGVVSLSESLSFDLEQAGARTGVSVVCPGFVATNILDSARNRPAGLEDATPVQSDAADAAAFIRDQVEKGHRPTRVGELVLSAIREERFYVFTDSDWSPLIEDRMRIILDGRNPARLPPPGVEPPPTEGSGRG